MPRPLKKKTSLPIQPARNNGESEKLEILPGWKPPGPAVDFTGKPTPPGLAPGIRYRESRAGYRPPDDIGGPDRCLPPGAGQSPSIKGAWPHVSRFRDEFLALSAKRSGASNDLALQGLQKPGAAGRIGLPLG